MIKPKKITAILKVTENCNYNCEFCYYAKKEYELQKNMDINLCKYIIDKCALYNYKNNYMTCSIIFHGGEPLLRGINFFEEIMNYQEKLKEKYSGIIFDNTIQTNGSLINDDWIDFFKKNAFVVGISLDGDEELNYHHKEKNDTKIESIIQNYKKLDNVGVNVGILSVITDKHCDNINCFYDFIKSNNIRKLSILPCVNDSNDYTVNINKLSRFYKDFFDLYFNADFELSIREYNDAIKRALGYNITSCKNCHRIGCGTFLTFDSQGNVFFCDEAYDKEKIICNIASAELDGIFNLSKYKEHKEKCQQFYDDNCKWCDINNLCGGDCYRNDTKLKDGRIVNRFCEVSKTIYPYIEKRVKEEIK